MGNKEKFNVNNIEMRPCWIRHLDIKFNILHILRSKKDLYRLLDDIEQHYKDILVIAPEHIDGNQSDDGREFDDDYYNRYSREFTSWHVRHTGGIMNRTGCRSVLDVGFGVGSIMRGFLKNKVDTYGIDISKYAIENCNEEIQKKVSYGDIRKIDTLHNRRFDLVTCYSVLEQVSDPDIAIYNICNLSDRWIHITVRDIRGSYPEDIEIFEPTLITGRDIKWWIDEFEKEGFDLVFDTDYTWLIFEPRYSLTLAGCPVFQALFRRKEYIV